MSTRPFPVASIALTAIAAVILAVSSTISERHCAFGFGGFQCNSPVAGYGDMLLIASLGAFAMLIIALPVAAWRLIAWFRAR
ncbi:hypothetical protein GB928_015500 [Shinella curvata]|uniref:Disulfide bond formation protein DsbB n=1 Tax=Shinella curvata TaxID=1817964 RepID=A0ABT8XFX0_9HYPH|nr:hypothetical protein [Shinella curvata]MCJ8053265.1 hypothetical protein [Shinella curvata]MDO6122596.1 hypothetical protein [Shinella curvata]